MYPNWKKIIIRLRKSIPVSAGYENKVRRIQYPFYYSNCFTICKIIGQTLLREVTRLSVDKKYSAWERELLTAIITKVHNLSSNCIVSSREEAKNDWLILLEMNIT